MTESAQYFVTTPMNEAVAENTVTSVNQPSAHPTTKVGLGVGLGGGVLVGIQQWLKLRFGFELLDIEVGLLTWLGSFGAAYFIKAKRGE